LFVRPVSFADEVNRLATEHDFEVKGYIFESEKEQIRAEKRVRVAVIQNAIVLPTSDPVEDQRHAIHERVGLMVQAAFHAGANIVCFQEAWSE
jgi:beta-ureidopropionase